MLFLLCRIHTWTMKIYEQASLLGLNTFHVDAFTRYLAELSDEDDIRRFLGSTLNDVQPKIIMGGGSNILFTNDFKGCIIRPLINGIEIVSENREFVVLRVGAGIIWDEFVNFSVEHGYGGIENLSYIPGTVGAAPVQNIGAYGAEIKNTVDTVEAIDISDGTLKVYSNIQCRFSYRSSIFKSKLTNKAIITRVTFRLSRNHNYALNYNGLRKEMEQFSETNIKNIRTAIISIRKRKLPEPGLFANAGSFFKNPFVNAKQLDSLRKRHSNLPFFMEPDGTIKLSAAWLIEQCGWKGKKVGSTGIWEKQPLVIVNYGGASGHDILQFAQKIKHDVMNNFGIRLETEVQII